MRLRGRTALVTGGMSGIGLAIAERFLAEGASVLIADLAAADAPEPLNLLARLGSNAAYLRLDIAEERDWQAAERRLRQGGGRLDILVQNAGMALIGQLDTLSPDAWVASMRINVDGVFLGFRTLTPLLAETGANTPAGSSVVTVSSIMGIVSGAESAAYSTAKGALRLMSRALAIEFARGHKPIRVNTIHPGFVWTPMLQKHVERQVAIGLAPEPAALIQALEAATPMGRLARPDEIAAATLFLASDDSSFMTGAELVVDGGWTAQ